ncbi:MAG TPA: gamma-glutamyltransferase, partial [Acidimicrobiales bacterium]|nr:gamma-glutamyltransferase [Acidimicrobiales bacterium]
MTDAFVAAGHPLTADAAVEVLEAGGNAYDAVVAACFAAAVAEPCLTSLAGGGFLVARTAAGDERLFDFFVDTPGRSRADTTPHFVPVTIRFPSSTQDFNVGWGSAGVPGVLAGLLHIHSELGRLGLDEVVAPAASAARRGVVLNAQQGAFVALLEPILRLTDEASAVYAPGGRLLRPGDVVVNEALGEFITAIGSGRIESFADASVASPLVDACDRHDGLLTQADLDAYAVVERDPMVVEFRGRRVLTNSPPSFGGPLLARALRRLDDGVVRSGSEDALHRLSVLREVEKTRLDEDIERRRKAV